MLFSTGLIYAVSTKSAPLKITANFDANSLHLIETVNQVIGHVFTNQPNEKALLSRVEPIENMESLFFIDELEIVPWFSY